MQKNNGLYQRSAAKNKIEKRKGNVVIKTNKSGQKLYPFSSTENSPKLFAMYHKVNTRLQHLENRGEEQYPGETDILRTEKEELCHLTDLCSRPGIIYLSGNLLSRAKLWVSRYDAHVK